MKLLIFAALAFLLLVSGAEAATTNLCATVTATGSGTTHNFVTALANNCTFSIAQPAVGDLANVAGGTVLGNSSGSSAAPSATITPVLGIGGTSTGTLGLSSSGGNAVTLSGGTASITAYTIVPPPAAPASNGQAWTATTAGVGSWTTIATASRTISSQTGTTLALASANDGTMYDNLGNAGTLTATMTQTAGDNWCFTVVAAHPIIITAGAASTIDMGGVISATAGNVQSTTIGSVACVYVESGTADFVYSSTGPWAVT
jgi:hypothetical protein